MYTIYYWLTGKAELMAKKAAAQAEAAKKPKKFLGMF